MECERHSTTIMDSVIEDMQRFSDFFQLDARSAVMHNFLMMLGEVHDACACV